MDEPHNQVTNPGSIQGLVNENKGTVIQNFGAQAPRTPERVFDVPYARNDLFTGRGDLLKRLHDHFRQQRAAAINGLGGIGKTQAALEYAYRHKDEYPYVFWTNAAGDVTLSDDFVKIARLLRLPEKDEADQTVVVEAVKNWLAEHDGWLLILDNADDLALARRFIPAGVHGHILLTTRKAATVARGFSVAAMDEEEGALFLLRRAGKLASPDPAALAQVSASEREAAVAIVREMAGLPLALTQAGAYIADAASPVADYLPAYKRRRTGLLARSDEESQYPASVATTWLLSFEKVARRDPLAAELLLVLAFLAPDAIPEELLITGASELGPTLQPLVGDPTLLNDACAALSHFSLVQRDTAQRLLAIHRLVQTIIQANLPDDETRRQWAESVVRAVNKAFPDVENINNWPQCERYLPHALACAALIEDYSLELPESARLLNQTAYYLNDRARYEQAVPMYERALAIRERVLGAEHPNTAQSLSNLAALYDSQGRYEEALPLLERALAIYEQVLGAEHPRTATSLNNLAELYRSQGKYEEALPLYERALAIYERVLGAEHPRTAMSLSNLAALYDSQGRYEEALPLLERALAIRERVLGAEHPHTAASLNNLAGLYRSQGRYEEALPMYERALAILMDRLWPQHPNTRLVQENYRALLERMGKDGEGGQGL